MTINPAGKWPASWKIVSALFFNRWGFLIPINKWKRGIDVLPLITAFALGAVSVASFAPLYAFFLIWLTLAGLCALLVNIAEQKLSARQKIYQGALTGLAFGLGFFLTGVSWIYVSMSVFGGMSSPLAALATVLFCSATALYPSLACAVFCYLSPERRSLRALLFAALWALSEWLRGWLLTGFPWLSIGYSQTSPSPLAGYVPVFGVFGASLLIALISVSLYEFIRQCYDYYRHPPKEEALPPSKLRQAGFLATIFGILALGQILLGISWTHKDGPPFTVSLLQGNISQDIKWQPEELEPSLELYYQMIKQNPARLMVLPETAFPSLLNHLPQNYLDTLQTWAKDNNSDILFGVVVTDPHTDQYYNAAVTIGISPQMTYRKSHLVPFGEYVPPGFSWFMSALNIPMANLSPGPTIQEPMKLAGQKVAINICYEDVFGEKIIRALPKASVLLNLSNVAWFGNSLAPAQHLQIAQIRALETGRMMLRSTNTGMTAIIGIDGRVKAALPSFIRATLHGEVQGFQGSTPYVRWGNWPVVIFALTIVLFVSWRKTSF